MSFVLLLRRVGIPDDEETLQAVFKDTCVIIKHMSLAMRSMSDGDWSTNSELRGTLRM
jgi:hypothetical protein